MRHLSNKDDELISAEDLSKMSKRAERDYKTGKVYKLKSLADLM
ncbi:MAG: hypothetical protein Q7K35_05905 [bacterium]|nr:hypothetical protein [bacterium]